MTTAITIVGLGPGRWGDLTIEAYTALAKAATENRTVYFRTLIHPTVGPLKREVPNLHMASFDHLYDESSDWETLYRHIAEEVCTLATHQPMLYVVPGHPMVGESSVQRVLSLARERNLSTSIIAGLSFLEPVCSALKLDPLDGGVQLIDATALAALDSHEIAGAIIPTQPLLIAQVYNRRLASAVKLALSEIYPDEWAVRLVRAAGMVSEEGESVGSAGNSEYDEDHHETVVTMPLYELDRNTLANHLSTLYVPPLDSLTALRVPETLRFITMRLRRDPDGCPWDREQTHQSLTRYVIEETYEVVEALEENNMEKLAEELGDLLLQVYLHAEIARQEGDFAIGDVFEHVNAKLIRRHPHVFGEIEVNNSGQVVQNWEAIKKQERIAAGKDVQAESVLDHVPQASPALIIAQEYQKRAARRGFEFANIQEVLQKLAEELQELQEATTPEEQHDEMGDVLFIAAKVARMLNIDAEAALRHANRKFRHRFQAMEEVIRNEGGNFTLYNTREWMDLWERVKGMTGKV